MCLTALGFGRRTVPFLRSEMLQSILYVIFPIYSYISVGYFRKYLLFYFCYAKLFSLAKPKLEFPLGEKKIPLLYLRYQFSKQAYVTEWQLIHVVSHLFIHSGKCMELYQNAGHFYRYVRYSFEQNREKVTVIHAQPDNV